MTADRPGRVIVVGSLNQDLTVTVPALPLPGATVTGDSVAYGCGGKGANQAVAAARMGARVLMIGCVGDDPAGAEQRDALTAAGVDASGVRVVDAPTGLAVITVAADGENMIVVISGANASCGPDLVADALAAAELGPADVVVTQAEIPAGSIVAAVRAAADAGARSVVNVAPAVRLDLPPGGPNLLVVNRAEAAELAGADEPPAELAAALAARHRTGVVVTLGANGLLYARSDGTVRALPAYLAERVVDSTGAGDAFVGALAAALAAGESVDVALRHGAAAGSIAVASAGARPTGLSPDRITRLVEG